VPSRKPAEGVIAVIIALLARDVVALPSYASSEGFSNGVRRFTKRCEQEGRGGATLARNRSTLNRVHLISASHAPNQPRAPAETRAPALGRREHMFINARIGLFLLVPLLFTAAASAQQNSPLTQPGNGRIYLDVVVTPKSGAPVTGLQQQDFTLLDNKTPQTVTSFQALGGSQAPIEVILLVDAVNTGILNVAREREQIDKFLRANGGHLAHPTAIAVFTDTGLQFDEGFSSDGNALSASLDQTTVGLRSIRRSAGFYSATARLQLSIEALRLLVAREAPRPGRKLILWVSPGWPLLPGSNELGSQQQQIFATIVSLSTQLIQARITLYSIDPLNFAQTGGSRAFYYKEFLKGISKPSQVSIADLGLQVLATQSGGLVLNFGHDVAYLLQECLADTEAYYELSFDPPPADHRDQYHHLEIKLAKPGLTARTRQGYYAQPLRRT